MKAFERIFLYSVLVVLVFYVFLVDGNVESKVAIQEEIRARSISIVNDAGQEVVLLFVNEYGGAIRVNNKDGNIVTGIGANEDDGIMGVTNKEGTFVATMGVSEDDNGIITIYNKEGTSVAYMVANKYGGVMSVKNQAGNTVAAMGAYKDDGSISVYNKSGKVIGSLPQNYCDNKEEAIVKLENRLLAFQKEKLNIGRVKGETSKLLEGVLEEKRRKIIEEWIKSGKIEDVQQIINTNRNYKNVIKNKEDFKL